MRSKLSTCTKFEQIGKGSFGTVFKVTIRMSMHDETARVYTRALKVSNKSNVSLKEEIECLRAIQTKGMINSKFVVKIDDVFTLGGRSAFTMQYLKSNLTQLIESQSLT